MRSVRTVDRILSLSVAFLTCSKTRFELACVCVVSRVRMPDDFLRGQQACLTVGTRSLVVHEHDGAPETIVMWYSREVAFEHGSLLRQ